MPDLPHILVAGGGFAGFSCAIALAERGIAVTVLERKKQAGIGMHTTGIIVKECAEEFAIPEEITRRVRNVRLFAPNLRYTDLKSSDYFFLTTDTPSLMRFFSEQAEKSGAKIIYDTAYENSRIAGDKIEVNSGAYICDYLIGADGPRSKVSADHSLGKNSEFLLGAEAEYSGLQLGNVGDEDGFYCFLDQKLAHGYLGWIIPGVGVSQVGIAQRLPRKPDIEEFVSRMRGIFDFSAAQVMARRGGLIPCGGLVRPFANERVFLVGDAAGIVSPLTAGGIHTALRYGRLLGVALAEHILESSPHPALILDKIYPRFRAKLLLRKLYEHIPDSLINFGITNPLFHLFSREVFYRRKKLK